MFLSHIRTCKKRRQRPLCTYTQSNHVFGKSTKMLLLLALAAQTGTSVTELRNSQKQGF